MFKLRFELIITAIALVFILNPLIVQLSAGQSETVNVSNTSGDARRVQLFVDGNDVFTVWTDNTPETSDDVFFAKSNDGGKNFDTPINLSQNNGSSAFPRLAVSESNVYVVWYDYSPGQSDIFFAKSADGGNNFEVTNVSDTPMPSYNPWIGAFSNYVYLVFNDGGRSATLELPGGETRIVDVDTGDEELVLLRSEDYGETFEFINLSNSPNKVSWNARIKVSEPDVVVTWNERVSNQSDIFFSKSSDHGKSFSKPINLSNSILKTVDSAIGVFENNIYIVWNDMTKNSTDIFFAKSTDKGDTFSKPLNLSNSSGTPIILRDGSLAVSDGKIFLVWYDESEKDNYIFFTRSTDEGLTFSTPINLSQSNATTKFAQVVANGKNVYVVWHDYSQGNGDIFLRESNDYGATFGSIKNLSNDKDESTLFILGPQIALSEDSVFTVWQSKSKDSSGIFLTSFSKDSNQTDSPFELSTLNGAVDMEVSFDAKQLKADEPSSFTFRFYDSTSRNLLNKVNYSIEVFDANEQKVVNMQNLFAESGVDSQMIIFPDKGPFKLLIDIKGTGVGTTYDTKNSGTVSVIFTVVPEFPAGIVMSLAAVIGLGIIISLFKTRLFFQQTIKKLEFPKRFNEFHFI